MNERKFSRWLKVVGPGVQQKSRCGRSRRVLEHICSVASLEENYIALRQSVLHCTSARHCSD